MFWLKGWSGIGRGCPGSGGVTIPGSAQKALACGTWGCGVVLNMAGLRWWLNSVTLEAFSIPNSSVILYIYCALAVPIRLSPLQIPHSFGKAMSTCSPQRQPPLKSLESAAWHRSHLCSNSLYFYTSLHFNPPHSSVTAGCSWLVSACSLQTPPRRWSFYPHMETFSYKIMLACDTWFSGQLLALSKSSETPTITSILLLGQECIKTELKIVLSACKPSWKRGKETSKTWSTFLF